MIKAKQDINANPRGSLLKEMEADSDSDVPEFSLPPKSVVKRPRKTIRKRTRSRWRKSCRNCCRYCSGVLLVLVLSACALSITLLFWFSIRLYRDVENLSRRLTIEINRVQAEQVENMERCDALRKDMEKNVQKIHNEQKDMNDLKRKLHISFTKIGVMNRTLLEITHQLNSGNNKVALKSKVSALQKGMADTGAEITKLSDEMKQIEKQTTSQSSAIRRIFSGLWNISHELANVTGKPESAFHPVKYFLGPSNDDKTVEQKNLKKSSFLFTKMKLNDQNDFNQDNLNLHSPAGNLSKSLEKVQRDVSSIQHSLTALNFRIRNLTRYNTLVTNMEQTLNEKINNNVNEITLLWNELGIQNETLIDLRRNTEIASQRQMPEDAETIESTQAADSMYSEPVDHGPSYEKRRHISESDQESKFRDSKSNSDSKHSENYSDLINNKYLD